MPASENSNGLTEVRVAKGFRDRVIRRAEELFALNNGCEISAVIAQETGQPPVVIDWLICQHAFAESRRAALLEMGIRELLEEARENSDDIGAEICRVLPRRRAVRQAIELRRAA